MQVYFTVNAGKKFRDSSWCPLNRRCPPKWGPLNTGFIVSGNVITTAMVHHRCLDTFRQCSCNRYLYKLNSHRLPS